MSTVPGAPACVMRDEVCANRRTSRASDPGVAIHRFREGLDGGRAADAEKSTLLISGMRGTRWTDVS